MRARTSFMVMRSPWATRDTGPSLRLLIDHAIFHDERDTLERPDVPRRIAGHRDQIGEQARADSSEVLLVAQDLRIRRRRRGQRLGRRHSIAHHPLELAVVGAVRKYADIAA